MGKRLLLAVLASGLWACGDSGSSSSGLSVTNLELYAFQLEQGEDLIAFRATEGQPGVRDAHEGNGDGDEQDSILFVHDLRRNETRSLGVAVSELHVHGRSVAYAAWERREGARDLNGDGDDDDFVLYLYDADRRTTRSTGVAVEEGFQVMGDLVSFAVDERHQGQSDLNGDGDAEDYVAFLHRLSSGTTQNLGLAVNTQPVVKDELVALASAEDGTLRLFDARAGTMTDLGLVVASDPLPYTPWLSMDAGRVLFSVLEFAQGVDLNGDGDTGDEVLHVHERATGTTFNTGVEDLGGHANLAGALFMTLVREVALDLNGDGDQLDLVMHAYDIPSRALVNLGVAGNDSGHMEGQRFLFFADEYLQGESDLNGDGDHSDPVLHTYIDGVLSNVGATLAAQPSQARSLPGDRLLLSVDEPSQGRADLDGDGDALDRVLHVWSEARGLENLRLQGQLLSVEGECALVIVHEGLEDLNGNGNVGTFEPVVHRVDLVTGEVVNLGLSAGPTTAYDAPREIRDGSFPLLVDEFSQRADLNGDGLQAGSVLHVVRLR